MIAGAGWCTAPGTMMPATMQITNRLTATPLMGGISILAMTLSPLRGMRQQLAQAIEQFFDRESGGSRAGREFAGQLVELALALGIIFFRFLVGDKSSRTLLGRDKTAQLQLPIGAQHGVGIDCKVYGELAHRR